MDKKKKILIDKIIRGIIQLIFFIMLPELFQAAFSGIKYIATQMHKSDTIELTPFILCLIILISFTIVSGRFFCGFACAFGSFGDAVYIVSQFIQKKINKKLPKIPDRAIVYLQKIKYLILASIVILCFIGSYEIFALNSPWTVFSKLQALEFKTAFPVAGVALFILLIAGMCIEQRLFCQFLCPMGAVFSLLPVIVWQHPRKREDVCLKGCNLCSRNCPVHIEPDCPDLAGECIQCYKCVSGCPVSSIHIFGSTKVNHNIAIIAKAVLLFALAYVLL